MQKMLSNKEIAVNFLNGVASGDVFASYEKYASIEFKHHNMHYKGDLISLRNGMYQSQQKFPHKTLEIKQVIAEGDSVMIHSHVRLDPNELGFILAHIFKIQDGKIIELWDFGQAIPEDSPNQNGAF